MLVVYIADAVVVVMSAHLMLSILSVPLIATMTYTHRVSRHCILSGLTAGTPSPHWQYHIVLSLLMC